MANESPGQTYFNQHVGFLMGNDLDSLVTQQYTEDAVLISPFDVLGEKKPPHILHGRDEIKNFLRRWLDFHGKSQFTSLTNFAETDNSIFFQAIFTSNTGRWVVGDAWHMTDGMIDTHYSFAYRIGDPT